ncbi:MAG: hypothetical protein ACLQHS_08600 [Candidatus Limnocylindrales bacterium]
MSSGPRLSRGPVILRSANEREQAILHVARRYVLAFPGSPERGELADHWYRVRRGPSAVIRREFLKAAGREELLDETTGHEVELHLGRHREGWIGVTVWFRTADRLNHFLKATHLENAMTPGMMQAAVEALPARHTRGHGRARNRAHSAATVARVLAVHYLSTDGGGSRSLEEAAQLYREELQRTAEANRRAGYPPADEWQALGDEWRAERSRVLDELQEEFGAL